MKIIHLETKVQTTFGVLDEFGNVISKQSMNLDIFRLSPDAYQEAFQKLDATKLELQNKIDEAIAQKAATQKLTQKK